MKKPEKKEVYQPTDKQVSSGAYYDLREIKGYNQGRADMEKYHNWKMSQLPSVEEIEKMIWEHLEDVLPNVDANSPEMLRVETAITDLAKAISKRIREQ